jgi:hypothetical protein
MLDVGAGSGHTLKKVGSVVRYVTPLQKLVDKSFGINKSVWTSFWDQSRVEDAVGAYRELAFPKPPEVVVRARQAVFGRRMMLYFHARSWTHNGVTFPLIAVVLYMVGALR